MIVRLLQAWKYIGVESNVFASRCARKAWYFGLQFHRFCQIMGYVQLLFQVYTGI